MNIHDPIADFQVRHAWPDSLNSADVLMTLDSPPQFRQLVFILKVPVRAVQTLNIRTTNGAKEDFVKYKPGAWCRYW
jgi:hypothetical protein